MKNSNSTRRQPDLRTEAIVLRRTDYGEADRILQLLTPEGKRSVIAKGARKEKSKLAGGIELFSISEVVIHEGRTELGILTGAKLLEYYDAFVKDIELIEMGGVMMRSVSARAEQVESPEFYKILKQSLQMMQKHAVDENKRWKDILRAWWGINLARASGEDINLHFDTDGDKLLADGRYYWDEEQAALAHGIIITFAPRTSPVSVGYLAMLRLLPIAEMRMAPIQRMNITASSLVNQLENLRT